MQNINIRVLGYEIDFGQARAMAEVLASKENDFATLISWNDKKKDIHSPQCLQCEIKGAPGWEVYGKNHDGRLRISINEDTFVFIYS